MKYIKLIPLAISIAMLITLIYMTFVRTYYLSASFHSSAFSQTYDEQRHLYLVLSENLFWKEIEKLNLSKVKLALSLISTAQEMLKIDQLAIEDKRKELSIKLQQRLRIIQTKDTLQLKLHVTKNSLWKSILRSALLKNEDLNKIFDGQKMEPVISWKTNYIRVALIFVLTVLLSYIFAIILLILKQKNESLI